MIHTIIGINGSTGIEIAAQLRARNLSVRGISRRPYLGDWEHISADVLDKNALISAVSGSSVVYACFGLPYDLKIWRRDWLIAIENVIESCLASRAKLVFVDNVYMYGFVKGEMTEKTPMNPTSEKGKVRKAVTEALLQAFSKRGLTGCIARSADFYGENCPNSMFTETVIKNALQKKTMQWLGRLDKRHAFTYTSDIGRSTVILGLDDRANGEIWHLPTATAQKSQFFIDQIAIHTDTKPKAMALRGFMLTLLGFFIPVLKEMKEMMYQFDEDYLFSSQKYEKMFNDFPTPYEVGLKNTMDWYKKERNKKS